MFGFGKQKPVEYHQDRIGMITPVTGRFGRNRLVFQYSSVKGRRDYSSNYMDDAVIDPDSGVFPLMNDPEPIVRFHNYYLGGETPLIISEFNSKFLKIDRFVDVKGMFTIRWLNGDCLDYFFRIQ